MLLASGPIVGTGAAEPDAVADPCPDAMPVSELTEGMAATGLTVERGTTPDEFTAEVLGVINDGIAPGVDMIIADTDSTAIQRAGGIWAGMSGSPVYAADGRLIGAVAYGLSLAPSSVAGIVPAEDMLALLDKPATSPATIRQANRAALPKDMRQELVRSGAATSAQAEDGMRRLQLPVAVSGLTSTRLAKFSEKLHERAPDTRVHAAGAGGGTTSTPADIVPGGNFAAALSYGDFTAAGVGTTTVVCAGDTALAFGHPFLWTGASSMSVHAANAVYVQRDNTFGSYKIANPLGVVGTLDQDRLAGIRAMLGAGPATVPVTSSLTMKDDGSSRDGTTNVTLPDFLPLASVYHLLSNLDKVTDRIGKGTSELRWVIDGKRASGAPFQVDVKNRYASEWDISFESIFDALDQIEAIQRNPFEDAQITGVRFEGALSSEFKRYSISEVLLKRPNGTFQPISTENPLRVVTGSRLNLRVVLAQYKNIGAPRNVDLSVIVPPATAGNQGYVSVTGANSGGEFEDGPSGQPASFDELLADLKNTTPNNSVNAALTLETPSGFTQRTARQIVDQVVTGEFTFPVQVVSAPRSLPARVDASTWKLRSSLSTGSPTKTFSFGDSTYRQLMGDFNSDGKSSPALFKSGTWRVRMTSTTTRVFTFGQAGDIPVTGDWNGDGKDDIGVFRKGRWLLRNSVDAGAAHRDFAYGSSSARPVAGDWDGDGTDSIGTYAAGNWRLRNSNSAGPTRYAFTYGRSGDLAVVGDWNRDGRDRPGVYRAGKWFARNTLTSGSSAYVFTYGGSTSRPLTWH